MQLFDTSAAIEWLNGNEDVKRHVPDLRIGISAITVYELLAVALKKGKRSNDAAELFIDRCTVFPVTLEIARRAAEIKSGLEKSGRDKIMPDILIAATAELQGVGVITTDKDFVDISKYSGVPLTLVKHR